MQASLVSLLTAVLTAPVAMSALSFVAQDAANDIKITLDQRKLHHELILKADADTKDVRVAITKLNGPTSITPACLIGATPCSADKPFEIPRLGSVVISIDADVVPLGTYTAILTIITSDSRADHYLVVTRTAGALPVQAPAEAKLQETTGKATVRAELREMSGLDQTLNVPRVAALDWSSGEKSQPAKHGAVRAWVNDAQVVRPWTLHAGDTPPVRVEIDALDEPGHYTGRIRYSAPDAQFVEQTITMDLRRPKRVAAIWIALGVILSFILHLIAKARPWVAQQQTAAGLVADLETIKSDLGEDEVEETRVAQFVASQLDAIVSDLDQGKSTTEAALQEIDLKIRLLRKWLPARKRYRSLSNTVATAVRTIVDNVAAAITTTGLTRQLAQAPETALDGLDPAIENAQDAELTLRIASLQKAVGQANLFTDHEARTQAAAIVGTLTNAANDIAAGRRDVARSAYELAQNDYAKALAKELRARIDPNRPNPFQSIGFDWASVTREVDRLLTSAETDPARRLDLVRAALGAYLTGSAKALATLAELAAVTIQGSGAIPDAAKVTLLTNATNIQTTVKGITNKIAAGDVEGAAGDYAQAVRDLDTVKQAAGAYGLNMGGSGTDTPENAVAGGSLSNLLIDVAVLALPHVARVRRDPSFFRRIGAGLDIGVLLLAFGVAIYLGVRLLWEPNLTWGTSSDVAVAILWGLGMHQVAGNTFEGLDKIVTKFSTP